MKSTEERTFYLYWCNKMLYVITAPDIMTNRQIIDSARREVSKAFLPVENPAKFDLMLRESDVKIEVHARRQESNGKKKN